MDNAFEFLMENVPVALAMIVMAKLFLTYLKGRDEATAAITEALNQNTVVLAELKTVIEGMDRHFLTEAK